MPDNREIVLEALLLHDKGEYADKIIKSILDKYSYLEKFERGFINRVFTGTIERRLSLDFIINHFSTVKVNKQKPVIRAILRMSTYQILYMDSVPDSAAINEAVKLAKKKKFQGLSGFVNGVLRKISKEKAGLESLFPDKNKDAAGYLSIRYSCPEWLCEHFINECGFDRTEKILETSLEERPLVIRTNLSYISTDELADRLSSEGISVEKIEGFDALILSLVEGLGNVESFSEGLFCVQDLSSQEVLLDDKVSDIIKASETIVDVCAAPGGKTCHAADLSAYLGNKTVKIISRDLTDNKVDKIDDNLDRCDFNNVITEVHDALILDEKLIEKADLVIADLPCSGLGVIGRKVDIKYRVTKEDLLSLRDLQREILKVVSQYVKKDGMLIFSTCTVNKAENKDNAEWITKNLPFKQYGEAIQKINDGPLNDGFFISRYIRE